MEFFLTGLVVIWFLSISVHELGHAYATRECGVTVNEISLLGFPGLGTITLPIKLRMFPGTVWKVHPLILGAYIRPCSSQMKRLGTRDLLYISGAGPLANIAFSVVVFFLFATILAGLVVVTGLFVGMTGHPTPWDKVMPLLKTTLKISLVSGGILYLCWSLRRLICQYLLLPIGCLLFISFSWGVTAGKYSLLYGMSDFFGEVKKEQGEGEQEAKKAGVVLGATDKILLGMVTGSLVSFALGLGNLLPLLPLDGGHMMRAILPRRFRNGYALATILVFLLMFFLPMIVKDFCNLIVFLWQ